ncbi:MAG: tetratricopeptide repeat protein [Terracidiphilus sp.]|jgi:tetratricopeptide (TPR) repeat protein
MPDTNQARIERWTRKQAILLSVVCLAAGIGGGWLIRGTQNRAAVAPTAVAGAAAGAASGPAAPISSPAQLKQMADTQALPLLNQLKSDAKNPDLLTSIGNLYYDAKQYPSAVDYYGRLLKEKPSDAAVRTDMGTAYWYMGDADSAIAEFNKALAYAPTNPNTLFNLGLVKWQGKKDSAGAIADWEKLLAANPNYDGKAKVEEMMAQARQGSAARTR